MITRRIMLAGACLAALLSSASMGHAADFTLRVASVLEPRSDMWPGFDHFAARAAELTGGRLEVTAYKNTLGKGERQLFEAVQLGTIEGALATTGTLSGFVPEADLFNLPFLFRDTAHAFKVVDGEIGEEFNQKMVAKGFRILGWWVSGTRNTSNNVREINAPEDYAGLKIRTMESPPFIALYKKMGAIPVPMSIAEVYTALSQGTIDGIDGSLPAQLEFKHIEVLKYAAITDHVVLLYPFVVSERWWQSLPEDVRAAIVTAEAEGRAMERKDDENYNKKIEAEWTAQGKVITRPDMAKFREIALSIYPDFYDKVGGKELIDRIDKIGDEM